MAQDLSDRIEADLIVAAKARDEIRLQVLRLLKAALKNHAIELKGDVSPQHMLQILQKEAKKRHEAAEVYTKADRPELAAKEQAELAILEEYLPTLPTEADMRSVARQIIDRDAFSGMSAMGTVIEQVRSHFDGVVDSAQLARIVREELS